VPGLIQRRLTTTCTRGEAYAQHYAVRERGSHSHLSLAPLICRGGGGVHGFGGRRERRQACCPVVIQATRDCTVKTVQKAADLAAKARRRLYPDSASSYRGLKDYVHEYVKQTQKEYAHGDVHEHRAECLFSLLKPSLRMLRGLSKTNLPGDGGLLSIPAALSVPDCVRAGRDDLVCCLRPIYCEQSQKGGVCQVSRLFQAATRPDKLSGPGYARCGAYESCTRCSG
jgi:hypothetical protein